MRSGFRSAAFLALLASAALTAQQPAPQPTTAAEAPNRDTSFIDAQGTAHVTRVIPIPANLSAEAKQVLSRAEPDQAPPEPLAQRRSRTDAWALTAAAAWSKLCPNQLVEDKIAGVPVRIVTPDAMPEANRDKVLLNLHGGGLTPTPAPTPRPFPSPATPKSRSSPSCIDSPPSIPSPPPWTIRWPSTWRCSRPTSRST